MQTEIRPKAIETIIVVVRGRVLEQMAAGSPQEAEDYKAGVRRWAAEHGLTVSIWSHRETLGKSRPLALALAS